VAHQVTIVGSRHMPSDRLGRGVRATVEVTDEIRKLVEIGAVTVVDGSLDAPTNPAVAVAESRIERQERVALELVDADSEALGLYEDHSPPQVTDGEG
jgi:hypothetical protein